MGRGVDSRVNAVKAALFFKEAKFACLKQVCTCLRQISKRPDVFYSKKPRLQNQSRKLIHCQTERLIPLWFWFN